MVQHHKQKEATSRHKELWCFVTMRIKVRKDAVRDRAMQRTSMSIPLSAAHCIAVACRHAAFVQQAACARSHAHDCHHPMLVSLPCTSAVLWLGSGAAASLSPVLSRIPAYGGVELLMMPMHDASK
jgi:hypothetical protein